MPLDLDLVHRVAVEAAEAGGSVLREAAHGPGGVTVKNATGDVVTPFDRAAERAVIDRIRATFPGHAIQAEESEFQGRRDGSCRWVIDPLDGTNNLAIGLHTYVVGVALCEDRHALVGVVHDPIAGHTWSAVRGQGAFGLETAAAPARRQTSSCERLVAWTQGHTVPRRDARARALRLVLESRARRVLQLWAPLLSWVMLARGDLDGFIGYQAEEIDMPAGALIAREAGVVVCGLDGSDFDERIDGRQEDRSFVAGRPEIMDELFHWVFLANRLGPDLARLMAD